MSVRIICADVMDGLRQLEDESVNCVCTSPPYYGLRDYGTATWEGGSSSCNHVSHTIRTGTGMAALGEKYRGGGKKATPEQAIQFHGVCRTCGATRIDHQIGLEPTPEAFVTRLVEVFREVRRALRSDGTLWLNIGDSYCNTDKWGGGGGNTGKQTISDNGDVPSWAVRRKRDSIPGIKPKDLVGIPWMLAFALRADGWWLRQEIIWHKPNPMPESIRDRCTKAHEHVFLLSKSGRYFFDAAAIAEPAIAGDTRNKRSVWTIATQAFAQAHFATFPEELAETCIKAGCPAGGTVLDPFGGAGTAGLVADRLGRDAVLIELNAEYAAMAERRIAVGRLKRGSGSMADVKAAELPPTALEAWLEQNSGSAEA